MQRIIIFANGEIPDLDKARLLLRADDTIICADGGTRHALALGLQPNLIIGDMDSAEQGQLQKLQAAGVPIELFSHDKNETDLELAIKHAIDLHPNQIIIIGALGGRLDQTLANIGLLSDPRHKPALPKAHRDDVSLAEGSLDMRLDDGVEEVFICRDHAQVHGKSGDLVSLIPWQGPATNVQTENLKWPLQSETLYPHKTRGISNEMITDTASVSLGSGLLLIVHRRQS
jgi:thiamine pyrophosphokinase